MCFSDHVCPWGKQGNTFMEKSYHEFVIEGSIPIVLVTSNEKVCKLRNIDQAKGH